MEKFVNTAGKISDRRRQGFGEGSALHPLKDFLKKVLKNPKNFSGKGRRTIRILGQKSKPLYAFSPCPTVENA